MKRYDNYKSTNIYWIGDFLEYKTMVMHDRKEPPLAQVCNLCLSFSQVQLSRVIYLDIMSKLMLLLVLYVMNLDK
ncbi:MAG: hypothetical protein A2W85_02710 [Bacteroidetes bacterium GWF2_41_31]|nr:MAG: hypothetical protein A2W85_02710 [Bacteroidetes bacterium GWF2_41_31]OFZ03944.1 MAG: hypothetical protein A2338_06650 [Bacteroidetes bacterium RIFOXYB12_FULL_41_6]